MKQINKNYFVTKQGEIYSNISGELVKLNPYDNRRYKQIEMYGKCYKVHRLVAMAFIPCKNKKLQVNHKNGIKYDNRVENLEWCDNSYNQKHAWENGLQPKRSPSNRVLTNEIAKKIREEYKNTSTTHSELAKKYNVSKTTIGDLLRGKYYGESDYNRKISSREIRKLTNNQVKEIRYLYKNEKLSYRKLGEKYNVSASVIRDIVKFKTYKEIQ